jgi:hypothetical protein
LREGFVEDLRQDVAFDASLSFQSLSSYRPWPPPQNGEVHPEKLNSLYPGFSK